LIWMEDVNFLPRPADTTISSIDRLDRYAAS